MFLALRDLRRQWRRFVLVGSVVGLVAVLSTILGALAAGLVDDGISGLRRLPLTHLALEPGSGWHGPFSDQLGWLWTLLKTLALAVVVIWARVAFPRLRADQLQAFAWQVLSTLASDALDAWEDREGVDATPLGVTFVNAKSTGDEPSIDLALFGVAPDSFLLARPEARSAIGGSPGLVLAEELRDEGVEVGDEYVLGGSDVTLPVLGFTYAGSYGHVPIAFAPLDTWRQVAYGAAAGDRSSAIALRVRGDVDLDAADRAAGTESMTKVAAYDGSPGYAAETATMPLIRGFLLAISALIVGSFVTVLTIQRTRQNGLLKAMGASTAYVVRDGIGQIAVVVALACVAGSLVGAALARAVQGGAVPVSVSAGGVAGTALVLVITGVAGSLVAMRRIARVEPVVALKEQA